jgi:hypothetical protein
MYHTRYKDDYTDLWVWSYEERLPHRDSWFLIIRGVQESDAGKYLCQVTL